MVRRILRELATVLTVMVVVVFCTYGMWNGVSEKSLPSEMNKAPNTTTEAPTVPSEETEPPTAPSTEATHPSTEATEPATKPTDPPAETTEADTLPTDPPAETTEAETQPTSPPPISFSQAPEGYFEDALFIGDSRTVGLMEYGNLKDASFFATSGMSVYTIFDEQVSRTSFEAMINSRTFGKIYVMLGINELGYDFERTVMEYGELIQWIRRQQPDAIIYIEANLHVSAERSGSDKIYNNANLDAFNARIADLADGKSIFYLDVNSQFDDEQGNLAEEYTVDDTHILGKYYRQWSEWIMDNAVVI